LIFEASRPGDGPSLKVPVGCFVITRRPPASADPVFMFVPDGIDSALAKAKEVAGEEGIALMGVDVDQQYLAAGLVHEIRIHPVNVLLGRGRPAVCLRPAETYSSRLRREK
jgi:dihydrofolate reductase